MKYSFANNKSRYSSSALPPDAIVVCGIGLRLPVGIETTQDHWDLLIDGQDAGSIVLKGGGRFNPGGSDDPLGEKYSICNQNGYFLQEELGLLAPSFFRCR
jgi:acyl transferase domain-containing protein